MTTGVPERPLQIEHADLSLIGHREENQDRVAIADADGTVMLAVVDGMGGHADGARAAEVAMRAMLNEFWAKRDLAAKKGVKILSAYVAVTEHTYYITVQAKNYQSLLEFFEPLAPTQIGAIHPVTTMDEWTKHIDPKRT